MRETIGFSYFHLLFLMSVLCLILRSFKEVITFTRIYTDSSKKTWVLGVFSLIFSATIYLASPLFKGSNLEVPFPVKQASFNEKVMIV